MLPKTIFQRGRGFIKELCRKWFVRRGPKRLAGSSEGLNDSMHNERFRLSTTEAPDLAIFIIRTPDGTHTGILHKIEGSLYILDQCWHKRLLSQPFTKIYPHVVPRLEFEEISDVTALCRLIDRRHREQWATGGLKIPFAFRIQDQHFGVQTGKPELGIGLGLSCSMFVLKIFESAKVPIIDHSDWEERPDDNARHQQLLAMMKNGTNGEPPASPEEIEAVRAELPCIRVRPEETAAGLEVMMPPSDSQSVFVRQRRPDRGFASSCRPLVRDALGNAAAIAN
jgi:hypothetical protein